MTEQNNMFDRTAAGGAQNQPQESAQSSVQNPSQAGAQESAQSSAQNQAQESMQSSVQNSSQESMQSSAQNPSQESMQSSVQNQAQAGVQSNVQNSAQNNGMQDGTYRYSYRDAGRDTQGAFAADRIGYSYTSNGQYAHYQMHGDAAGGNASAQTDKKAAKAQRRQAKAERRRLKKIKRQERRKSGRYPLGARMAAALLCGALFAGAAYGTCYGIERLTGTKLIIGAGEERKGDGSFAQLPVTEGVGGVSVPTQGSAQDGSLISTDTDLEGGFVAMDVRKVAKALMPSIVTITNEYTQRIQYWGYEYEQKGEGSGSGIIVGQNDDELLICTNYHVIEKAENLTVTFADNTTAKAAVKGTDASNDLAVIAVRLDDLEETTRSEIAVARLGDSDQLEVGEPVIAIGNALGYGQSVTAGYVSALNRELEDCESPMIQTDAAINPGNSGGALINARGEVIGIPSAKIGATAVEGMGYAIPISVAEPILRELMVQDTKVEVDEEEQGYLGIIAVDVESSSAQLYNMPQGVYIYKVYDGYAADLAGLRRGDIITAINGARVDGKTALVNELRYYSVGTTVTLTVSRIANDYESEEVQVTLGEAYEEINS